MRFTEIGIGCKFFFSHEQQGKASIWLVVFFFLWGSQTPHDDREELLWKPELRLLAYEDQASFGEYALIGLLGSSDALVLLVVPDILFPVLVLPHHILLDDDDPAAVQNGPMVECVGRRGSDESGLGLAKKGDEVAVGEVLEHPLTPDDVVVRGL